MTSGFILGTSSLFSASSLENVDVLAGRLDIRQRLQLAIAKARLRKSKLALLFVDIDRFHTIHSTLGSAKAKELVDKLSERLQRTVGQKHILIYLGADEFVVLLSNVEQTSQIRQLGNRLLTAIRKPFLIEQQPVVITASIGASVYPSKAEDDQSLLQQAMSALDNAKHAGGDNFKFFTQGKRKTPSIRTLNLEMELRNALSRGDLSVHYQPKLDLASGQVMALEALVRWHHDDYGWISPSEFIPIAEAAGLIGQIGEEVLHTACRHGARWRDEGIPQVKIAVNLSAKQLVQQDVISIIERILRRTGFPSSSLVIELTESMIVDTLAKTKSTLNALRAMGIDIAIDDFGTGYSTFRLLKDFPVDILKIDQMFIRNCENNKADIAITRAIIDVAHALGMRVIAEGVENTRHVDMLQALGCDYIQGFYLSEALPREEISTILKEGVPGKAKKRIASSTALA